MLSFTRKKLFAHHLGCVFFDGNCQSIELFNPVNEESSEFEVAVFDRIVPWAQQADKKTLNLGYKNKQLFSKYSVILA